MQFLSGELNVNDTRRIIALMVVQEMTEWNNMAESRDWDFSKIGRNRQESIPHVRRGGCLTYPAYYSNVRKRKVYRVWCM